MRRATISSTFTVNTIEDGESPIFADLDNEMFGVACDADGKSSTVVDKLVNVSLWYGLTKLTLSELTYAAPEGVSVTTNPGVGTVRIAIPQGTALQETNTISLVLKASYGGIEYTRNLSITISAIRGGADAEIFEWMPNVGNVLKKDDGTYSISSVLCTVQRIKGDSVSNVTNPSLYGLTAYYSIDGNSEQPYTIGSGIDTSTFTRSVRFSLYKGNTLVDRENILMVYDGSSGYVLDLDNENDSILYDGNTIIGSNPQTTWTLYKGGVDISDSVVKNANTVHITAEGCTANFVSGSVYRTVQVDSMTAETGKVTISVTHGGNTYSAVMSVKKLVGVDKYEIVVAPNAITYNETDQSKSSSSWINIKVYRTSGATGNRMFVSNLANESLTLFISPIQQNGESAGHTRISDGSSQGSYTSNDGASRQLATNYPQFKVELFQNGTSTYGTGVLQDAETIPIIKVEDGADGRGIIGITTTYALSNVGTATSDEQGPSYVYGGWDSVAPEPTETYRYLWRREVTRYTDGNNTMRYYLQSMRGMDGGDALTIDIDNEMQAVALDQDGYVVKPSTETANLYNISLNVKMYLGPTAQILTSVPQIITPSTMPQGITVQSRSGEGTDTGRVVLNIFYGEGTSTHNHKKPFGTNNSIVFTIQAECAAGTLFVPFTLVAMRNGTIYSLVPSASSIVKKKGDTRYTPVTLRCNINKYLNGETITNPANDVLLYYIADNGVVRTAYTAGTSQSIESYGNPTKSITFEAEKDGVIVDRETIPIVVDGTDGEPAPEKTEIRYAWSTSDRTASATTAPVLDSGASWQERIPNRPTSGTYYLWQRIQRWTWNTTNKEYALQSTTYFRMSGEDAKATQIKGLVRKVWAHSNVYDWPDNPQSGDKVLIISNPSMYVYNGTSWSLSLTASVGDAYVFSEDSHVYVCISTTDPVKCWQDVGTIKGADGASAYIHIAWANSDAPDYEDFTTSKNPEDVYKYIGVCSGIGEEPDPENPLLYTWSEIKGYDASTWLVMLSSCTVKVRANGTMTGNIAGTFYKETRGEREIVTDYSTGSSVYVVIEAINASGVQHTWRYSATYGTFSTGGWGSQWLNNKAWSTYGNCPELRVSCEVGGETKASLHIPVMQDGQQGERGKVGRNYYFRGAWEDFINEENPTFQVTDSEAPFFTRYNSSEGKNKYWVFIGKNGSYTPSSTVCPPSDNGSWMLMVTDFRFLIGEAIFMDFAKLGSAIFNKDWMFSQYGYTGTGRGTNYETFSPQFPNTSEQTLQLELSTITSTALVVASRDKICPLVMKAEVRYSFAITAKAYTSSDRLTIVLMNPDGEAVTFGNGSNYLAFTSPNTLTGFVTPSVPGTYYWVGVVNNASEPGTVQSIKMTCEIPFVPTACVDWLNGYAHFSGDKVRFEADGRGHLAGGNISWDADGNASFAGNVNAESGNIGNFDLQDGNLQVQNGDWGSEGYSAITELASGVSRFQKGDATNITQVAIGQGMYGASNKSALVVFRNGRSSQDFTPTFDVMSVAAGSPLVGLRVQGGTSVLVGGGINIGHYQFASDTTYLSLRWGSKFVIRATYDQTIYLPSVTDVVNIGGTEQLSAGFTLNIQVIAWYNNSGTLTLRFQDGNAFFCNHNGGDIKTSLALTRGRSANLELIYDGTTYYAQRLGDGLNW